MNLVRKSYTYLFVCYIIADSTTWCVNLYWGGMIIPVVVISYDPPFSKGFVKLDESVSYDKLVGTICEMMGINISEHKFK